MSLTCANAEEHSDFVQPEAVLSTPEQVVNGDAGYDDLHETNGNITEDYMGPTPKCPLPTL